MATRCIAEWQGLTRWDQPVRVWLQEIDSGVLPGDFVWRVQWGTPGAGREGVTFNDRAEADEFLDSKKAELGDGWERREFG